MKLDSIAKRFRIHKPKHFRIADHDPAECCGLTVDKAEANDAGFAEARAELYRQAVERKGALITSRWTHRRCLEAKGAGEISGNEGRLAKLMVYDTKLAKDDAGKQVLKPYEVCDRVGNRGGMLRTGVAGGGGPVPGM